MGCMMNSLSWRGASENGGANRGQRDWVSPWQCSAHAKMGRFESNGFQFRPSPCRKLNGLWPFQLEAQLLNQAGFNSFVGALVPSRLCGCAGSGAFSCRCCGAQRIWGISDATPIAECEGVFNGFCAKGCAGKPAYQRHRTIAMHGLRMIQSLARQEEVWVSGS